MQLGVYEVAAVDGAADGGGGEIDVEVEVEVGERHGEQEFLGGERFEETVWDNGDGITLAALAGFD